MKRNTHPLAPRNWPLWLAFGLLRLVIFLPHAQIMTIGRWLGRLLYHLVKRRVAIARINIALCFPERSPAEQEALVRAHFESAGQGLMEFGMGYWMSDRRLDRLIAYQGIEHIQHAFDRGRGVIFLSAHFTSLELSGLYLSRHARYSPMYRPHENPVIQYFVKKHRTERVAEPIAREDVRGMLRALKNNRGVWFAPDQHFDNKAAVAATFFSVEALSNPATSRFARMSGACVLPFYLLRRADNTGYLLCIEPPLQDFPGDDVLRDTQVVNDLIESWVRLAPSQYNWMHRRFKKQVDGQEWVYRL
jgi:KDO2-lipid IV(A) lauroyltransferase